MTEEEVEEKASSVGFSPRKGFPLLTVLEYNQKGKVFLDGY